MTQGPLGDIFEEARRVVGRANEHDIQARLLGGLGVWFHAHEPLPVTVERTYGDIDIVVRRSEATAFQDVMREAGYVSNVRFNALHGDKRLMFFDEVNERRVDVFVGRFEMCHALELDDRLPAEGVTLSLADLLLTKLQVVQLNLKDILDTLVVLRDHPVEDRPAVEAIDVTAMLEVCANDWGWFTTVTDNLVKVDEAAAEIVPGRELMVRERIARLTADLERATKSRRWRIRSKLGRRAAWYQLPEEV